MFGNHNCSSAIFRIGDSEYIVAPNTDNEQDRDEGVLERVFRAMGRCGIDASGFTDKLCLYGFFGQVEMCILKTAGENGI